MFIVEVEKQEEKRRNQRVRFQEAVDFQIKDTPHVAGSLACDLSEGGIKINLNDFVPLNTEIDLTLFFNKEPNIITLSGKVVWIRQIPFSERYQLGLEFIGNDPDSISESAKEVHRYIQSRRI